VFAFFQIVTQTPLSGSVKGSCFPPAFGGACSGIPEQCERCLDVCEAHPELAEVIVPIQGEL
jgi:hypothetical protein